MSPLRGQVWVTSILQDNDVESALLLCTSLRRAHTSRKVAAVLSPNVSINLRNSVYYEFDYIFYLDEKLNKHDVKLEEYAKMFSLVLLQAFDNCAYLSPTMLALKNCDDIFFERTNSFRLLPDTKDTSVFIFKPSLQHFKMLLAHVEEGKGADLYTCLKSAQLDDCRNNKNLESKYNVLMQHGELLVRQQREICIVNLRNFTNTLDSESLGTLGELVIKYQKKLEREYVQPVLDISALKLSSEMKSISCRMEREPVAIVGMSCRYPGSNNLEEFWNLLIECKDGTGNPPPFRWLKEQCSKPTTNSRDTNAGFLKNPVDEFDTKFFGIATREALFMDPQQRLVHELVWEGLEDASINPQTLRGTAGSVFFGSWINDYKNILEHSGNDDFFRCYMGNSIGAAAARISFLLGLTGPCIATESGCSSAMVAVHLACKSLQNGETNLAIACGVNLILNPFDKNFFPVAVSADGRCKTFSDDANGFGRAEGGGVLVLKRLSDAVREGDRIWALIQGSAVSQEGVSESMGTPTVHSESLAMELALADANVEPEQVTYVEAHGTGTVVGDPMEVAAIAKAYHSPKRQKPLIIGSVKTNVGHTESCAGITGIMKVVLAMHYECIPAHRNFSKLNPSVNLDIVPAILPMECLDWKRAKGSTRFAGVSSFGITGTDTHVILEEAPENTHLLRSILTVNDEMKRPLHIIKVSTKSQQSMNVLLDKYKTKCQLSEDIIDDIAFTANTGRADFPIKAAIIAKNKIELSEKIKNQHFVSGNGERAGKICFLFTGLGSQHIGMAKQLYETSPVFKIHFDHCDKILRDEYNISVMPVIWGTHAGKEICQTIYSQSAVFCVQYALLKLWDSWGVKPDYVLGHSFGEFAAAVCAGILTLNNAIKLVAERSKLIGQLPCGKMLAIKADNEKVEALMIKYADGDKRKVLDVAAINSTKQTVVAGDPDLVLAFSDFCKHKMLECIPLEATHAFHSKHMEPMLKSYRKICETLDAKKRKQNCYFISGLQGNLMPTELIDTEYWIRHTRDKVNFLNASKCAIELGCRNFIEIGPHPVLSALIMINADPVNVNCFSSLRKGTDDWLTLLTSLANLYVKGVEVDWMGFDQFYSRRKVSLPLYPFIGKRLWPDIKPQFRKAYLHPLIGCSISNATSIKLFQSEINLSSQDYLKDHAIGSKVIFPGACYLEMCLASGVAALQGCNEILGKPHHPLQVENLILKAPLSLNESAPSQMQTVVDYGTNTDRVNVTVEIFHQLEQNSTLKWMAHACALFSYNPAVEEHIVPFDAKMLQKYMEKPCDESLVEQFYDRLALLGYNFGPRFKNIYKMWPQEGSGSTLVNIKNPTDEQNYDEYIVHPIILDAMLQSIIATTNLPKGDMIYLPIKIGKFVWLSKPRKNGKQSHLFVHTFRSSKLDTRNISTTSVVSLLLDSAGKTLAVMTGVEIISTTLRSLEYLLEQQTNITTDLYEEVWCPEPGPTQYPVHLDCLEKAMSAAQRCNEGLKKYNDRPDLIIIFSQLFKLVYYNMLKALYECGWAPNVDQVFSEEVLRQQLKIDTQYVKQFHYFLTVFEEEGIIQKNQVRTKIGSKEQWKVIQIPPSLKQVKTELSSRLFTHELVEKMKSTLLISKIGSYLSKILRGTQSPLSILFPEPSGTSYFEPSAEEFYREYQKLLAIDHTCEQRNEAWFNEYRQQFSQLFGEKRSVFKILEIGAGTGGYTQPMLTVLERMGVEFEYTYTDISSSFFISAEEKFKKFRKQLRFAKLNIEEDPILQGFVPGYYDMVCAYEVLHATKNLSDAMHNVRTLLKPNGFLDVLESTRINRFATFIFGLLDGFWRFEDKSIRTNHCTLSHDCWVKLLQSCGFRVAGNFQCANGYVSNIRAIKTVDYASKTLPEEAMKTWIVFHQKEHPISEFFVSTIPQLATGRKVVVVACRNKNAETAEEYFTVSPSSSEEDFIEFMRSVYKQVGVIEGIVYCWSLAENENITQEDILRPYLFLVKSFKDMNQSCFPRLCVLTHGTVPVEGKELSNIHPSTIWGFTKSLQNENPNLKCNCIDISNPSEPENFLQIFYELWNLDKTCQVAFLKDIRFTPKFLPHKPIIQELKLPVGLDRFKLILPESKLIEDLQFGVQNSESLALCEIEIQVKSIALNFRDLLTILKPSEDFNNCGVLGADFAGVVVRIGKNVTKWSVGDRVFGMQRRYFFPSHIKLSEDRVIAVPESMTFCEASTLPIVFSTTFTCLVDIANVTSSDTVLIHTASGGVGLSAIEICMHIGAKIIATVGSKRKENYLRSLGIKHIFNSRNTEYEKEILKVTKGKGVDVVLNSLTSHGFKEATLNVCNHGARFVEMSRISIWSPFQVTQLRPDVKYTIVNLLDENSEACARLLQTLEKYIKKRIVNPLPYVRFDGCAIQDALQFLKKAQHIGKVVCVMPEHRRKDGMFHIHTPIFHANATYLITGGLGGIGFEICKWMLEYGAKYVVLAGRNLPNSDTSEAISKLNSEYNAKIQAVKLDVSSYKQCKQLIESTIVDIDYPALRGIMHAAGSLHDGLIENQTWETFSSTFSSKVQGALNLHELTKNNSKLEHFVLFSSIAAVFGSPGQSNHAAGNHFEDTLAHYRRSLGLPALSVNWGLWGEVGIAKEVSIPGIKPISTAQALRSLEYALKSQQVQLSVVNIESFTLLYELAPQLKSYIDEKACKTKIGGEQKSLKMNSLDFWKEYHSKKLSEEKEEVVKRMIRALLCQTLQLSEGETIDDNSFFQQIGVDSLMFVQLKNLIQTLIGESIVLSVDIVREFNTVNLLSKAIFQLIDGHAMLEINDHIPTLKATNQLIQEDCHLPLHIRANSCQSECQTHAISCVLLTGSTGTLGPYILKELSNKSQINEIVCLMRPRKNMSGIKRLLKVLADKDLQNVVDLNKVRCVDGDVALPRFNMNEADWNQLSEKVDAIIHVAVSVQHTEHYKKCTSSNSMRAVNVEGTKHVLELASAGRKLKHVFFASSLLAVSRTDDHGHFLEDWPEEDDFNNVTTLGYPITKFVGDILMKQAVLERGIPGKVFRFPFIMGDSRTGRFTLDSNHLMQRFMFFLKHKIVPCDPIPMAMVPVDLCAWASVKLFLDASVPNDIYNVNNTTPFVDQEFVNIAMKLGYKVDIVEFATFAGKVQESNIEDTPFAAFKKLYTSNFTETISFATWLPNWQLLESEEKKQFMISSKIKKYLPQFFSNQRSSSEYLYNDLIYAKRKGWLEQFC